MKELRQFPNLFLAEVSFFLQQGHGFYGGGAADGGAQIAPGYVGCGHLPPAVAELDGR